MRASTFWAVTVPRVMSIYATTIFIVLWVGLAIALAVNQEWLDILWNWVQALPLVIRIIAWVILTPIMLGLWIWQSSWPVLGRLFGFAGIAAWAFLAFSSLNKAFR